MGVKKREKRKRYSKIKDLHLPGRSFKFLPVGEEKNTTKGGRL